MFCQAVLIICLFMYVYIIQAKFDVILTVHRR